MPTPLDTALPATELDEELDDDINDPGNEDPGSLEDHALVPLIEDEDQAPA